MSRPLRIAAVTAGLLAGGALAGAVAAAVALAVALAVTGEARDLGAGPLLFAATLGALFGGVLLPVTAWLFLRRVPIGLAVLGTVVGTIVGGVVGWTVHLGGDAINSGVWGALAGFALAALLLRLRASASVAPRVSVRD
jgi:hypothetical protein